METKKAGGIQVWILGFIILSFCLFFSYDLEGVPTGLTVDEAAFGYNAALLSKTGRDENGRFLPLFVLSIEGKDWRQPVTQYYLTFLFKVFGPSIFLLRFSSVLISLFSAWLLFWVGSRLFGAKGSLATVVFFLVTPIVVIQSRLGLDNIMVIPFSLIWLMGLEAFLRTRKKGFVLMSAIALGLSFYSYKGMRAVVPVWASISCLFLCFESRCKIDLKKRLGGVFGFCLGILPFLLPVPFLDKIYPGAIMGGASADFQDFYAMVYGFISSFDPGFLFVKGDATLFHSTQKHGMLLLATLPLILIGIGGAVKKRGFWMFVLLALFGAPLLYGSVGSVHRASRLMAMVPLFCLLAGLGLETIVEKIVFGKKIVFFAVLLLVGINFFDFYHYYLNDYAKLSQSIFGKLGCPETYQELSSLSGDLGIEPFIEMDIYKQHGETGKFYEASYFETIPEKVNLSSDVGFDSGIVLTQRKEVPGFECLIVNEVDNCYIQIKE